MMVPFLVITLALLLFETTSAGVSEQVQLFTNDLVGEIDNRGLSYIYDFGRSSAEDVANDFRDCIESGLPTIGATPGEEPEIIKKAVLDTAPYLSATQWRVVYGYSIGRIFENNGRPLDGTLVDEYVEKLSREAADNDARSGTKNKVCTLVLTYINTLKNHDVFSLPFIGKVFAEELHEVSGMTGP